MKLWNCEIGLWTLDFGLLEALLCLVHLFLESVFVHSFILWYSRGNLDSVDGILGWSLWSLWNVGMLGCAECCALGILEAWQGCDQLSICTPSSLPWVSLASVREKVSKIPSLLYGRTLKLSSQVQTDYDTAVRPRAQQWPIFAPRRQR